MIFRRALNISAILIIIFIFNLTIIPGVAHSAGCSMGRYEPQQTSYTEEKLQLPVSLKWEYTATKYDNNPSSPIVDNNTVYFASGDRIYAVDLDTGSYKWRYPSDQGLGGVIKGTPLIYKGSLFFGATDGNLYCVDAANGKFKWAYKTRGAIRCTPVIQDGIIYFGSDDDCLYAISADYGSPAWPRQFKSKDDIAIGVAVGSGMVVASSMDGNMYGINQSSGKLRWIFRLPSSPVYTSPVMTENIVVMAVGNLMYGLTARSGQQRWMVKLPSEVSATPAACGLDIYVPCRDKKLYAYKLNGRQVSYKWVEPADLGGTPVSSPVIAGDTIFIATNRGIISAFSAEDGSLKWRYIIAPSPINTPGVDFTDVAASPTIANGALLVSSDDGVLHCFTSDAVDNAPPDVFNLKPVNGIAMSGVPPIKFAATLYDIGSGIDFSSVTLSVAGQEREYQIDYSNSTVSYVTEVGEKGKPMMSFVDGPCVIKLTAKDYRGNLLVKEWFFIVNNTLPPPRAYVPADTGKKTKEPPKKPTSRRSRNTSTMPDGQNQPGGNVPTPPPPPPMPPVPPEMGNSLPPPVDGGGTP